MFFGTCAEKPSFTCLIFLHLYKTALSRFLWDGYGVVLIDFMCIIT